MSAVALVYDDEQEQLRSAVRKFCDRHFASADVRRLLDSRTGYDADVWQQMAGELGLAGLGVPETFGGSGASLIEVAAVAEELGRALVGAPWFTGSALAVPALLASGEPDAHGELLRGIAEGTTVATMAFIGDDDSWTPDGLCVAARQVGDAYHLSGARTAVLAGAEADVILVLGATDVGPTLFAVATADDGVTTRRLQSLDLTRRLAAVTFDDVPATMVGAAGQGMAIVDEVLAYAGIVLAAECAGGIQRCVDMSATYAGERVQFGRIIGSFQAIKHICADMVVESEGAQAAYRYAAWAREEGWPDAEQALGVAQLYCTRAYSSVAAETIQVHGGIGFTWEHDAHLHLRRAKTNELLLAPCKRRGALEASIGL